MSLPAILMVVSFILLLLAGLNVPTPRVSLGWLGMACWVLAQLLGR